MPRKIAGIEISTIEELMVAMSMPRVAFDKANHLYRGESDAFIVKVMLLPHRGPRTMGSCAISKSLGMSSCPRTS